MKGENQRERYGLQVYTKAGQLVLCSNFLFILFIQSIARLVYAYSTLVIVKHSYNINLVPGTSSLRFVTAVPEQRRYEGSEETEVRFA